MWNKQTNIHLKGFFRSNFNNNLYPTKNGIVITIDEWNDLKSKIAEVDEVLQCTDALLNDDHLQEERAMHERQSVVNEQETKDQEKELQKFNDSIIQEICKLSKEPHVRKLLKLVDFNTNANFSLEFQAEEPRVMQIL